MSIDPNAKPSYVTFEVRTLEDRTASIEAGHWVGQDVDFAFITPQGSKDRIERPAVEWLKYIDEQVSGDRFPAQWRDAYKSIYKDWKEGREIPLDGTPILGWMAIPVNQQNIIIAANIRTVEDLALANESAVNAIGMGARALVAKAQAWLAVANDTGKIVERLNALEVANTDLVAQNAAQALKINELEIQAKSKVDGKG